MFPYTGAEDGVAERYRLMPCTLASEYDSSEPDPYASDWFAFQSGGATEERDEYGSEGGGILPLARYGWLLLYVSIRRSDKICDSHAMLHSITITSWTGRLPSVVHHLTTRAGGSDKVVDTLSRRWRPET